LLLCIPTFNVRKTVRKLKCFVYADEKLLAARITNLFSQEIPCIYHHLGKLSPSLYVTVAMMPWSGVPFPMSAVRMDKNLWFILKINVKENKILLKSNFRNKKYMLFLPFLKCMPNYV